MAKKLFALLLCLVMVVGVMPTAAVAAEISPSLEVQFTIVKKVEKTENAATPPAETFEFVMDDTAQEKKNLSDYGISLLTDLKIDTNGVGTYEKVVKARIDMSAVNENSGWTPIIPIGSESASSYEKIFHITEKNNDKDGWDYSDVGYAVTFKYSCDTQKMSCILGERGNDITFITADFTNTYTKQEQAKKTVELPFTVTVKQGGNVAPGKQSFELEIFNIGNSNEHEYGNVTCTAMVETNGKGDYSSKLVISGPENEVEQFTCEGFYVREKDTKAANWTYSDAVWYVMPIGTAEGVDYNLYPAVLKTSDNGEYYEFDREHPSEVMTFVNTYTKNETVYPPRPENPAIRVESNPNTGAIVIKNAADSDKALLLMALSVASGAGILVLCALNSKKKRTQ